MAMIENKPLKGRQVLISAGPTQEAIDPVRFISNHSTGKMGIALAWVAKAMGADVTMIHGPITQPIPYGINTIQITSAQEMADAFINRYEQADFIIKAAAVSDYRSEDIKTDKIKKNEDTLDLKLIKNPDILRWLGEHKKPHQILCGFAMETQNLLENAQQKLSAKHCDLLVANHLKQPGAGFATDTNVVTILTQTNQIQLPCMNKRDVSVEIWKQLMQLAEAKGA